MGALLQQRELLLQDPFPALGHVGQLGSLLLQLQLLREALAPGVQLVTGGRKRAKLILFRHQMRLDLLLLKLELLQSPFGLLCLLGLQLLRVVELCFQLCYPDPQLRLSAPGVFEGALPFPLCVCEFCVDALQLLLHLFVLISQSAEFLLVLVVVGASLLQFLAQLFGLSIGRFFQAFHLVFQVFLDRLLRFQFLEFLGQRFLGNLEIPLQPGVLAGQQGVLFVELLAGCLGLFEILFELLLSLLALL
mmetsp:Transcript_16717/g.29989  ORF Transcript_16717/g.29989 Transcript_16717/m.29989 type:complete len:248 (+) Transcript_16717:2312-3055(+)